MADTIIETWRKIIVGDQKSWVVFEHGTCVILMNPEPDLAAQAIEIMKKWGPVHAGSPAGDFSTIRLQEYPGWVVTGHHPDIINYVAPDEIDDQEPSDIVVGLLGRSKRDQDADRLHILHVEDRRSQA